MEDEGRLPVFTSVSDVEFPVNDDSLRKVFTLYNPYSYTISYKVLCTATTNYSVGQAVGLLGAKSCKDIVVRCRVRPSIGCADKLRIEIKKNGFSEVCGHRDMCLRSVDKRAAAASSGEKAAPFYSMTDSTHSRTPEVQPRESTVFLYFMAIVFCGLTLLLPTVTDPNAANSVVPGYLHLTENQKLVAAFLLGCFCILLLRPA